MRELDMIEINAIDNENKDCGKYGRGD